MCRAALGLILGLTAIAPAAAADAPTPATTLVMRSATERAKVVADYLARISPAVAGATPSRHLVTTLADTGTGSLRAAIEAANARPGMDLVEFDPTVEGRIELAGGPLEISDSMVLFGPGADRLTLSGMDQGQIISIGNRNITPDVLLSGLTISGGLASRGGGIYSLGAHLSLSDCAIVGNNTQNSASTTMGGGIYHEGGPLLLIDRCVIRANSAGDRGGGIAVVNSTASIEDSLISQNLADYGGGLYVDTGSPFAIRRTLVAHNRAGESGAGVHLVEHGSGTALIENSTVSGNVAFGLGHGGGAGLYARGHVQLYFSTIVDNFIFADGVAASAGAGVHLDDPDGWLELANSIVVGNEVFNDAADLGRSAGTIASMYSLIGVAPAGTVNGGDLDNQYGVDPLLGPLADNGGLTATCAIAPDSPARDAGFSSYVLRTDQRGVGYARMSAADRNVDIGAYEHAPDRIFTNGFDG